MSYTDYLNPVDNEQQLQDQLNENEDEIYRRTIIGVKLDLLEKKNRIRFILDGPFIAKKPLRVVKVPSTSSGHTDKFRAFIAPLLNDAELLFREVLLIGNEQAEIVVLREVDPAVVQFDLNGVRVLRGDGSWPWVAYVEGKDIVVRGAKTTAFGGGSDKLDSGETASGYSTKDNPDVLGCSIPMIYSGTNPTDKKNLGGSPIPKMPFGLSKSGKPIQKGAWVVATHRATGKETPPLPVIDVGPAKWTGHPLDLTVAAAKLFKPNATANNFGIELDFRILNGAAIAGIQFEGGFPERLANSALGQYSQFNGIDEGDPTLSGQIMKYWSDLGLGPPEDGVETAWSAVFVSWNVLQAGAKSTEFKFSGAHSQFVYKAIADSSKANAAFAGRTIGSYVPKVGDIIHNNRPGGKISFAYAKANKQYESHSAIVVAIGSDSNGKFATTVGGNEKDSVRHKTVRLHPNGKIGQRTNSPFICVIENRKA